MKIIYHALAGPDLTSRLKSIPGLDIQICSETDTELLTSLLRDCEVIWHVLTRCTAEMIASAPKLRLIQKIGVGVNTIDLEAAKARRIAVCNLPGTNAQAVAEMSLSLMLAVLRRIPRFDQSLRRGEWTNLTLQDGINELGGKTVGLIGYGAIPGKLAPVLSALGCKVIYTARNQVPDATAHYVTRETLLSQSDVISLHLPLTDETDRIINRTAFALMKKGAVLINTARGGLVDQNAMLDALQSGQLAGAGLDVFEQEPISPDDPLLSFPNVVLSPHIAWITTGTFTRSFRLAAENCRRLASGEELLHQVV